MIAKLHYITQVGKQGETHAEMAKQACESGVDWVQLRMKNCTEEERTQLAQETKAVCRQFNATFIINDHVALAKSVDADGVHIGKEDMSVAEARKILGKDKIIGATANTIEDILRLSKEGVDYIGLGPFKFTSTKDKLSPILGVEGYHSIVSTFHTESNERTPIIAIGGIEQNDIPELIATGVHGIATASSINYATNKKQTVDSLLNALNHE